MVLQAYGQAQPWVLLTDTPGAETEPTLYAWRNWIEQGFRGLKTVGYPWVGSGTRRAAFGPAKRGAGPPIRPHPSIPAQKIPL